MEETIKAWMAQNKDKAELISLKVIDIHNEFVNVEIGGNVIQVIIPSIFHDASSDTVNSDKVFLAICLEKEVDEALKEAIIALNEKLERVRIGPNSLNQALDSTLQILGNYGCKKPGASQCRDPQKEGDRNEVHRFSSYLDKLAEEARVQCEEALSKADECSVADEILRWCSISVDPSSETVEMILEINGIMHPNNVTAALGFCFDSPLVVTLQFKHRVWSANKISLESFRTVEVSVKQSVPQFEEASIQRIMNELDDKIKDALRECCLTRMHQYGPQILVPDLVKEFFYYCSTSEMGTEDFSNETLQIAESDNIFVSLLIYLGTRLSTLRNWCVVCKKKLSSFSRLWYCDAELCLYRFEELGFGVSVLQELQNSELVDLELSLAVAASTNNRDVFEPYPTFLLKEREIRGRSGFFSNYMAGKSIGSPVNSESRGAEVSIRFCREVEDGLKSHNLDNKMLHLLELIINSFPPLPEMQNCVSELELRLKLAASWLKQLSKNDNYYDYQFLQEDYAKNMWLPYNVLRYVLFTNRLSLHLLSENSLLDVPSLFYQFAVLYDDEREQYFRCCRAARGSIFAFHGSASWNWYSILRNGLRCLSNTKYMSTGMSYGQGIYFSTDMIVSCQYSRTYSGWVNGELKKCGVVAICEIFSGQRQYVNDSYVVVNPEHENDVAIRYLLVFNNDHNLYTSVKITDGHMLLSKTDLHKHYELLRAECFQKEGNGHLTHKPQHLVSFQNARVISKASYSCDGVEEKRD